MAAKTRKNKKVICYTGMNSKKSGVHTAQEFLAITRKIRKNRGLCSNCPKGDSVKDWIKWTGAEIKDEKACEKITKKTQNNLRKLNEDLKKQHTDMLRKIHNGTYEKNLLASGISVPSVKKMISFTKRNSERALRQIKERETPPN